MSEQRNELRHLDRPAHACWLVGDPAAYTRNAAALLSDGARLGQRLVVFGPEGFLSTSGIATYAAIAADPHAAFLAGAALDPEAMAAMFREQSALARADGYDGLRVVADMDWLLPARPTADAIVGFELLLDRLVGELRATVVCAYRQSSFGPDVLDGVVCVHPLSVGHGATPRFRLIATGPDSWRLSGEIDLGARSAFAAAFDAVAASGDCTIDVTLLDFADTAAMRLIAERASANGTAIRLRGASPALRRHWSLAGLDDIAPMVQLGG